MSVGRPVESAPRVLSRGTCNLFALVCMQGANALLPILVFPLLLRVTGAGPLWAAVMDRVTGGLVPPGDDPPGWSRRPACALSGGTPGPRCDAVVLDWVRTGDPDRAPCTWHRPDCSVAWPAELASWAAEHGALRDTEGCPGGPATIAYPSQGTVLYVDARMPAAAQQVPLRAAAPGGAREARWTVDGAWVATVGPALPALWQPGAAGLHEIALTVDGEPSGTVTVEVRGHPEPPLR